MRSPCPETSPWTPTGRYGNAVAPGKYPTEMVGEKETVPDFFAARLALQRAGRAEDIIGAVRSALRRQRLRDGQQLPVDGGRTIT